MTTSKIGGGRSKARIAERRQNALDGLRLKLKNGPLTKPEEWYEQEIRRLQAKLSLIQDTPVF